MPIDVVRFEDVELDAQRYSLRRSGRNLKLERIPMELLLFLVERRGLLVTREEIIEKLWGKDVFLDTDNSINTAIRKIRQALKDDPEQPRFVLTVAGKGYRFIAPIVEADETAGNGVAGPASRTLQSVTEPDPKPKVLPGISEPPAPTNLRYHHASEIRTDLQRLKRERESRQAGSETYAGHRSRVWWRGMMAAGASLLLGIIIFVGFRSASLLKRQHPPVAIPHIESLAVLPLENLSHDSEQDYFADGMTEELTSDLARIGELKVISHTSAMRYRGTTLGLPEIARELNVDGIVEGSVLRSGDHVRITVQLLDAKADRHLWAESYEREITDVLAVQNNVATDIASQIRVKLTASEPARLTDSRTVDRDARDDYLKGRYYWNKRTQDDLRKAFDYFSRSIARDPSYALPYSGLADYYLLISFFGVSPSESFPKAKEAALRALEIDDNLAEAHTSLGSVKAFYEWNWNGGEQEFKRAIALSPNYATAHQWYAYLLVARGRLDEAATEMKQAQILDPLSMIIQSNLAGSYYYRRQYKQAIDECKKTLEFDPNFSTALVFLSAAYAQEKQYDEAISQLMKVPENNTEARGLLGYVYAVSGKKDRADEILGKLQEKSRREYVPPSYFAMISLGLGRKDRALASLEQGYVEHDQGMNLLKIDPVWDTLRSDSRFQELLNLVNVAQ